MADIMVDNATKDFFTHLDFWTTFFTTRSNNMKRALQICADTWPKLWSIAILRILPAPKISFCVHEKGHTGSRQFCCPRTKWCQTFLVSDTRKHTRSRHFCCPPTGWCQTFLLPRHQKTNWIQTVLVPANWMAPDISGAQRPENTLDPDSSTGRCQTFLVLGLQKTH